MADELTEQESNPALTPPATPPAPVDVEAIKAQHAAELAAARAELDAHKQTLAAIQGQVSGGGQPQMVQAGQYQVPRDLVQQYIAQGHSEADAITLVKAILPALMTYGGPLAQQQQQMATETKFIRAAGNTAKYPDWPLLAETIDTLRAKYPGIEPDDAYTWARGAAYDKLQEAKQTQQLVAARAQDAMAQGRLGVSPHTRLDLDDRVLKSANDILALSDEDAQKLWDKLGDQPF